MPKIDAPAPRELEELLGTAFAAWQKVNALVEESYEMETLWSTGGKAGPYEYKYRRGGKTLCALYPNKDKFGFMVVLGQKEREKFAEKREDISAATLREYDAAKVYHDGLWLMLWVEEEPPLEDIRQLLVVKRRPNRKTQ